MKTIEEGLDEAYKKSGQNAYFGNGFNSGVEFAQRWIPIEEELPRQIEIFWKGEFEYDKGYLNFTECSYSEIEFLIDSTSMTHWRPIELK